MAQARQALNDVEAAFNDLISKLHCQHPQPLSLSPSSSEVLERAAFLHEIANAFSNYMKVCMRDTKTRVPACITTELDAFEEATHNLVSKLLKCASVMMGV